MSSNFLRVVSFIFLVGAAVMAILNLHRVADLGMPWAAPLLLIIGAVFMIFSRRGKR